LSKSIEGKKKRLKIIRKLADNLRNLEICNVYLPDLHLDNVLVTEKENLIFLDFDKAKQVPISKNDMERMFWRLHRYADKMEKHGDITFDINEKTIFLKRYKKLSGYDMAPRMAKKIRKKRFFSKMGWFIEAKLFGGKK